MLPFVSLVDQWTAVLARLPGGWSEARLRLVVDRAEDVEQAAALLGPTNPSVRGKELRVHVVRFGSGAGAESLRRLLFRLDEDGIGGRLALVGSATPAARRPDAPPSLAAAWDSALAELPEDWSDVYAEIDLDSSDQLPRAALLLAPVNPATFGVARGFRFRAARRAGYGVAPQMARRSLERLDADGIRGRLRLVHSLSSTRHVGTQGPAWYVGGRSV